MAKCNSFGFPVKIQMRGTECKSFTLFTHLHPLDVCKYSVTVTSYNLQTYTCIYTTHGFLKGLNNK